MAVGGYGRRELFPYSDVDLVLVLPGEPLEAQIGEPLSAFLRVLWDAGIKASHSVRTPDECCRVQEGNLQLSISLLDRRFLAGSVELFEALAARLDSFFQRQARPLLRGMAELAAARHARFADTIYHLEPDIKEGPGGVRDIHLAEWAARLGSDKEALCHARATAGEAREFLYRLRFFLHEEAGRDNNLLSFELQDKAAAVLPAEPAAPELWMRSFYSQARAVFSAARQVIDFAGRTESGLVQQFFERRDRLSTADYTVAHNQVLLRHPAATLGSGRSVLDLFRFVARIGVPLAWDTRRRLQAGAPALRSEAPGERAGWNEWNSVLSEPHAALALQEMAESHCLARFLPAWKEIESLVVRDFYHRYTVDEHTLVAIGAFDKLVSSPAETPARFEQLAAEENQPALVRLALLLHDIGKGTTPGDHVRGSLVAAQDFLASIDAPPQATAAILFLIGHHLDLSRVMNGLDPDDPATARLLSTVVGTAEDLRRLTLLTFADVSAVNPVAMSPWRAEQLWRVYSIAASQLTRELASDRVTGAEKQGGLRGQGPAVLSFLEGLPARYLRVHSPAEIREHYQLEEERRSTGQGVSIRRETGAWLLTVVALDRPGLFADLCGTLAGFGLNIVRAEAAANAHGVALDEFRFTDPNRTLELNPEEVERLRWTVGRVLAGTADAREMLKGRRAPGRPHAGAGLAPAVHFDNSASDAATLLYFAGEDRPGLLFDLASLLTAHGCNIEVVLVNTEGRRAHDVLYVTRHGVKLESALLSQLAAELRRVLP